MTKTTSIIWWIGMVEAVVLMVLAVAIAIGALC